MKYTANFCPYPIFVRVCAIDFFYPGGLERDQTLKDARAHRVMWVSQTLPVITQDIQALKEGSRRIVPSRMHLASARTFWMPACGVLSPHRPTPDGSLNALHVCDSHWCVKEQKDDSWW